MACIEPDISALMDAEAAREAVRARSHRREADRHRGVSWAGCGPEAFSPRSPDALMNQARRTSSDRAAWRESEAGRFLSAMVEGQQIAGAAHQACERARAAWSRDFEGSRTTCAAAARELRLQALRLLRAARLAQAASGSRSARGSAPRTAPPPGAPG